MLRIISGKFKGRKLTKSNHLKSLRPTKDSARENIFNILTSNKEILSTNFNLEGANILDVCCGTGSVAFEAISRGADSATMIENNFDHIELVKKNQEILDLQDFTKIINLNVKRLPKNNEFFDLVFIDPPYEDDYIEILRNLIENSWIQNGSIIAIEMSNIGRNLDIFENGLKDNNLIANSLNNEDFNKLNSSLEVEFSATNHLELLEKRKYGSSMFYFFKF